MSERPRKLQAETVTAISAKSSELCVSQQKLLVLEGPVGLVGIAR